MFDPKRKAPKRRRIGRRLFLFGTAAVAGGFAVGTWAYLRPHDNPMRADGSKGEATLNPYVWIDGSGVAVVAPRAEMGQGVHTTLAALVAEEMDLAWNEVKVVHGAPGAVYYNKAVLDEGLPFAATDEGWMARTARRVTDVPGKFIGMQITGGSTSTRDAFDKMREAGAIARAMLVAAAARRLSADPATLVTQDGAVIAPDGTPIPYAELAVDAAREVPPTHPRLKAQAAWKLLGTSLPRTDMSAKVTGAAQFTSDVTLPGMLHAAVKMNPHLGAPMKGYNGARAEAMGGVHRLIPLAGGVAVLAETTWHAFRAAELIEFDWSPAPYPASTEEHFAALGAAIDAGDRDSRFRNDGDVDEALAGSAVVEGEYRVPYLAHATMEVPGAVAWFRDGVFDLWAGTQIPTAARDICASVAGIDPENVTVHVPFLGGGFGRRLEQDFVALAAEIAVQAGGAPVKLTFSRGEDIRHDFYRPAALARFRGAVRDGRPVAVDLDLAAPAVNPAQAARLGMPLPGPDLAIVQAAWDQPYAIPNYRVTGYRAPDLLPASSWRSVGASQNAFFHESMIDELAHAAGADPLRMRIGLMTDEPSRKVLERVADLSGWGASLPPGTARGTAFCLSFGVPCAEVVEVRETPQGLRVTNVWAAVDVGIALDPRNIEAQVMSAIVYGLSAAIRGEITVADGQVSQSNFHDYDAIRMYDCPAISVAILENLPTIRGVGEPGLPPVAPALAGAVFALTGQRIRELPLGKSVRFA